MLFATAPKRTTSSGRPTRSASRGIEEIECEALATVGGPPLYGHTGRNILDGGQVPSDDLPGRSQTHPGLLPQVGVFHKIEGGTPATLDGVVLSWVPSRTLAGNSGEGLVAGRFKLCPFIRGFRPCLAERTSAISQLSLP